MDAQELVRHRLTGQQLRPPYAETPEDALRNLLAVQSQEFPYARWTLAQRTAGATAQQVEDAVADGRILRTHILRPTWHFVRRDDLRWLMALSSPRLHQSNRGMYRQTGLDEQTAARSDSILGEAVAGGRHKTREQLAEVLQEAGFAAKGLQFVYLIMHAEINGILVSGTPQRSPGGALKQSYALFDERVPEGSMETEAALARLALRYFGSRGPATIKDCSTWSGLTMKDVRRGLQLAAEEEPGLIETASVDGMEFHGVHLDPAPHRADRPQVAVEDRPHVDLVQCYDEYVMGYSQSRHYLGGTAPAFPVDDTPLHLVLLNGRLAGSWRHGFSRGACELDIRMTAGLDARGERALDEAVAAYGAFLGMPTRRL